MSEATAPSGGIDGRPLSHRPIGFCWWIHRRLLRSFHQGNSCSATVGLARCFVLNFSHQAVDFLPDAFPAFALPPHIRDLLNQIHADAPEPAVVRKPEPQETKPPSESKRKPSLSADDQAEADRIIRACLKSGAENNSKRSGWKQQLAQKLDRHPAWVTNRIKRVQAEGQAVVA